MTEQETKQLEKRKLIKINSIDDIKKNIEELSLDGYVPDELLCQVLKAAKINSDKFKHTPDINIQGYEYMMYEVVIDIVYTFHQKELRRKKC